MPRPIWFEIPADDPVRAIRFYEALLGWRINRLNNVDYWLVDVPGAPMSVLGGAIATREAASCTRNTISVTDLKGYMARVEEAGGQVTTRPMPIPGGTLVLCQDTEGNEFGLATPGEGDAPMAMHPEAEAMLTVVHFELPADDPERAIAFYERAFGWEISKWGGPMDYWLVATGPEDEPGMNGAIGHREGHACTVNTISVPDIHAYRQRLLDAGGKITYDVSEIPGVGWMIAADDTEGNAFGLIQSMPPAMRTM